jgi:hypothetical protein
MGNKAVDWSDPDTWKLPAALIDYWKTIAVGAVAIAGALGSIFRFGLKPFRWLRSKLRRRSVHWTEGGSERPLRFVQDEQSSFWAPAPAKAGQDIGNQVSGRWHVTNVSDRNIVLLRARLHGYQAMRGNVHAHGLRDDKVYPALMPIPAEKMGRVSADLFFFPAIISGNDPLVADIIFTDNYEKEHRVPSRFRYIRA